MTELDNRKLESMENDLKNLDQKLSALENQSDKMRSEIAEIRATGNATRDDVSFVKSWILTLSGSSSNQKNESKNEISIGSQNSLSTGKAAVTGAVIGGVIGAIISWCVRIPMASEY